MSKMELCGWFAMAFGGIAGLQFDGGHTFKGVLSLVVASALLVRMMVTRDA